MGPALTIFFWIAVFAALAILGWIGAVFAARAVKRSMSAEAREPFTLQDLREMRASGQITDAEFNTMRAAIIGHFAQDSEGEPGEGSTRQAELDELLKWERRDEGE